MATETTVLDVLLSCTTSEQIIALLRDTAETRHNVSADYADTYALGYLAEYVAGLHRDAQQDDASDDVEPMPLTDEQIDELLTSVSLTRLERLIRQRREAEANTGGAS